MTAEKYSGSNIVSNKSMIHLNFVFVGLVLQIFGSLSYIVDTLKGKVKPNRVSWLLWSIVPSIAFVAEVKQGVGMESLLTFRGGLGSVSDFHQFFC